MEGYTYISYFCSKIQVVGTHNLCLEQKYEKYQNIPTENFQFLQLMKSVYYMGKLS